jgi:hypothetical protein
MHPTESELLDIIAALEEALHRCYVWRYSPAMVAGFAAHTLEEVGDVLDCFDLSDSEDPRRCDHVTR